MTVWKILKIARYNKVKLIWKLGLTPAMKAVRLKWALDYKDWILEDWKNVIWTDEISVLLGYRRGGYRIWRRKDEAVLKSCIRSRWKGYSEFMFWGAFSYDKKGPMHIWEKEISVEKKAAEKELVR
jgi:hypothetical protein